VEGGSTGDRGGVAELASSRFTTRGPGHSGQRQRNTRRVSAVRLCSLTAIKPRNAEAFSESIFPRRSEGAAWTTFRRQTVARLSTRTRIAGRPSRGDLDICGHKHRRN
jgi:hypothetical protein